MATKTFTQFTAVTTLAAGDELVMWNAAAAAARKVTAANFIANSPNGGLAELGAANTFTAAQKIGTGAGTARLAVKSQSASEIGEIVQAAASPTANLMEWQDSGGTERAAILPNFGLKYSSSLGRTITKTSVAHNVSTDCATVVWSGGTPLVASMLISLNLSGSGINAAGVYAISVAFNVATVVEISEALFGYSALTLTATMNTGTRTLTLTVLQTNGNLLISTVNITVSLLSVISDALMTITVL